MKRLVVAYVADLARGTFLAAARERRAARARKARRRMTQRVPFER